MTQAYSGAGFGLYILKSGFNQAEAAVQIAVLTSAAIPYPRKEAIT
jgi:hypothetical protein